MLALDANAYPTILREDDSVGGYLTPETSTGWHRLMPSGDAASVVANNARQLNIGTLRSDILDVLGWNLMVLNAGYFEQHKIKEYANGVATLEKPLLFHEGLKTLGSGIEWLIYPTLDIPMGIYYKPNANTSELTIGLAKENIYAPTPKPIAVLEAKQLLITHTRQIQKIFYQGAAAADRISWGEHYVA